MAEWNQDLFGDLDQLDAINPWGDPQGTDRSVRGGHLYREAAALRAAFSLSVDHSERRNWVGFRCVRTPSF